MAAARLYIVVSIGITFASLRCLTRSSVYAVCTFSEVSGIFQLFTSHHHLLIFAPTDCPFSVDDLFMCLHPETISVHAIPCTKGMKICRHISLQFSQSYVSLQNLKTNLIPHRNIRHNFPILRVLDARKIALLEAQVWQRRHLRLARRRTQN